MSKIQILKRELILQKPLQDFCQSLACFKTLKVLHSIEIKLAIFTSRKFVPLISSPTIYRLKLLKTHKLSSNYDDVPMTAEWLFILDFSFPLFPSHSSRLIAISSQFKISWKLEKKNRFFNDWCRHSSTWKLRKNPFSRYRWILKCFRDYSRDLLRRPIDAKP